MRAYIGDWAGVGVYGIGIGIVWCLGVDLVYTLPLALFGSRRNVKCSSIAQSDWWQINRSPLMFYFRFCVCLGLHHSPQMCNTEVWFW